LVVRAVADRKLTQLDAFLGFFEKLGTQPADVFLADFVACGAARYYLSRRWAPTAPLDDSMMTMHDNADENHRGHTG
jgi:hypothetical protein